MLCYLAFCEYVLHLLGPMRKTPYASGDCGEYTSGFCFRYYLADCVLIDNIHVVAPFTGIHEGHSGRHM